MRDDIIMDKPMQVQLNAHLKVSERDVIGGVLSTGHACVSHNRASDWHISKEAVADVVRVCWTLDATWACSPSLWQSDICEPRLCSASTSTSAETFTRSGYIWAHRNIQIGGVGCRSRAALRPQRQSQRGRWTSSVAVGRRRACRRLATCLRSFRATLMPTWALWTARCWRRGWRGVRAKFEAQPRVAFRVDDFARDDAPIDCCRQRQQFDVILCLSVTKWVHLNGGDDAVRRLFRKAFALLAPGGIFVLEAQPWSSYRKYRRPVSGPRDCVPSGPVSRLSHQRRGRLWRQQVARSHARRHRRHSRFQARADALLQSRRRRDRPRKTSRMTSLPLVLLALAAMCRAAYDEVSARWMVGYAACVYCEDCVREDKLACTGCQLNTGSVLVNRSFIRQMRLSPLCL
jgi:SAM-dependent methyltransferase